MTWPVAAAGMTSMALIGAIVIVCIINVSATWRTRMSVARSEEFRRLAENAVQAQQETAERLATVLADLALVRERMGEVERLLKEVEEPRVW